MNKIISCIGKVVLCVLCSISLYFVPYGIVRHYFFPSLKFGEYATTLTGILSLMTAVWVARITSKNTKIAKASAEAAQRQAEAASEQTKAIQQQIEISQQQAKAAKQQADIARKELEEAQKQREEAYRPRLMVYFEKKHRNSLKLLVKNVGGSSAYHIKVKCEAPWLKRTFQPDCWKYLNPPSDPKDGTIPFYTELRPGQEISLWKLNCVKPFDESKNYDNFFASSPIERYLIQEQPLKITIEYQNNKKQSLEPETFAVNPSEVIFRHFQFDPEDTKIFSPLFVPTETDYEEMMRFIDDTVALHLGSTARHLRAHRDPSGKVTPFENTHELKGYACDLRNILPGILHGQYENCFKYDTLYVRFIEAVKEIWMQILRILRFQPIVDYLNGAKTSCCWHKRFPEHNSEECKRELKERRAGKERA